MWETFAKAGLNAIPGLVGQGLQNLFNHYEADINRQFWSEAGRYNRLVDLGFNPNLAAASVMGVSQSPGMPAVASSGMESLNEMQRQMYDMPAQKSAINVQNAEADYYTALKDFTNTQNDWFPLSSEAKINLLDRQSAHFNHLNDYYDGLSANLKEELKWMPIVKSEQLGLWRTQALQNIAQIGVLLREQNLISQQIKTEQANTRLVDAKADIAANERFISDVTLNAQQVIVNAKARYEQALADNEEWAVRVNELTNGFGLSSDMLFNLGVISACSDDGDTLTKQIVNSITEYMGAVNEQEFKNAQSHYWMKLFMNLGVNASETPFRTLESFGSGFGNGLAFYLGSGGGKGGGSLKAVPVNPKVKPGVPGYKPKFRIDPKTQRWQRSYQGLDGSEKWDFVDNF